MWKRKKKKKETKTQQTLIYCHWDNKLSQWVIIPDRCGWLASFCFFQNYFLACVAISSHEAAPKKALKTYTCFDCRVKIDG